MELLNNPLVWAGLAVLVIVRQFVPRAVRPGGLVVLPLVLALVGLQAIAKAPPAGLLGVGLFAADAVAAAGLGLARGVSLRIWRTPEGTWMRQGTLVTLVLWVVSIGIRVGLAALARGAVPPNELTFFLALTFGAQNLALWLRTGQAARFSLRPR